MIFQKKVMYIFSMLLFDITHPESESPTQLQTLFYSQGCLSGQKLIRFLSTQIGFLGNQTTGTTGRTVSNFVHGMMGNRLVGTTCHVTWLYPIPVDSLLFVEWIMSNLHVTCQLRIKWNCVCGSGLILVFRILNLTL